MPVTIPHTIPGAWPRPLAASRFASLVRTDSPAGCAIGLIGLADDLGVRLNGGRPGARDGPRAFREALARYGVADPDGWDWPRVFDAGDIVPAEGHAEASLHETHARVTEAVSAMLDLGLFPVGIGGGHDLTFPCVRAVAARCTELGVVYCDAHLDVRDKVGSGMAFRALVEQCSVRRLTVHGFDAFVNSHEHVEWFRAHGGMIVHDRSDTETSLARTARSDFAVSFDLDVIDAAHAPGVSAMNPAGWDPPRACTLARLVGANPASRWFDIMELCPAHDPDGRTSRLASRLFLDFLRGFAERASPAKEHA